LDNYIRLCVPLEVYPVIDNVCLSVKVVKISLVIPWDCIRYMRIWINFQTNPTEPATISVFK